MVLQNFLATDILGNITESTGLELIDGGLLDSGLVFAPWDVMDVPATDDELQDKFHWLVGKHLSQERAHTLETLLWKYDDIMNAQTIFPLLYETG